MEVKRFEITAYSILVLVLRLWVDSTSSTIHSVQRCWLGKTESNIQRNDKDHNNAHAIHFVSFKSCGHWFRTGNVRVWDWRYFVERWVVFCSSNGHNCKTRTIKIQKRLTRAELEHDSDQTVSLDGNFQVFEQKWNRLSSESRLCIMADCVKIQNPTILINTIVSYQHCTLNELPDNIRNAVFMRYLEHMRKRK